MSIIHKFFLFKHEITYAKWEAKLFSPSQDTQEYQLDVHVYNIYLCVCDIYIFYINFHFTWVFSPFFFSFLFLKERNLESLILSPGFIMQDSLQVRLYLKRSSFRTFSSKHILSRIRNESCIFSDTVLPGLFKSKTQIIVLGESLISNYSLMNWSLFKCFWYIQICITSQLRSFLAHSAFGG